MQHYHLTVREIEVLRLLSYGCGDKAIARLLSIAPGTARNHVANIREKLGVHTRLEAVTAAWRRGIIDPPPQIPNRDPKMRNFVLAA